MTLSDTNILFSTVLAICAVIGHFTGFLKWCWLHLKKWFKQEGIPKKTIIILNENNDLSNFWHIGSKGDEPILQIAGRFVVTNITDKPVKLVHSIIKGYNSFGVAHVKDLFSQYWGSYDIPPGKTTRVSIHFLIPPLKRLKKKKPLILNVAIVDQFNNKHWLKRVAFRPTD